MGLHRRRLGATKVDSPMIAPAPTVRRMNLLIASPSLLTGRPPSTVLPSVESVTSPRNARFPPARNDFRTGRYERVCDQNRIRLLSLEEQSDRASQPGAVSRESAET